MPDSLTTFLNTVTIIVGLIGIIAGVYGISRWSFFTKEEINDRCSACKKDFYCSIDKVVVDLNNKVENTKTDLNKLIVQLLEEIGEFREKIEGDLQSKASQRDLERLEDKLDNKADKEDVSRLEAKIDKLVEVTTQVKAVVDYKNEREFRS